MKRDYLLTILLVTSSKWASDFPHDYFSSRHLCAQFHEINPIVQAWLVNESRWLDCCERKREDYKGDWVCRRAEIGVWQSNPARSWCWALNKVIREFEVWFVRWRQGEKSIKGSDTGITVLVKVGWMGWTKWKKGPRRGKTTMNDIPWRSRLLGTSTSQLFLLFLLEGNNAKVRSTAPNKVTEWKSFFFWEIVNDSP